MNTIRGSLFSDLGSLFHGTKQWSADGCDLAHTLVTGLLVELVCVWGGGVTAAGGEAGRCSIIQDTLRITAAQ